MEKSWLRRRVEDALMRGLSEAYKTVQVDPEKFLTQMQSAYGLPVTTYKGVYSVEPYELDRVADDVVRASMQMAAAEGAGLGLGGIFTIIPDLGILSAITMRMIQKLSLVYGFEFTTEAETAELWVAAASAAGVDITRELVEKQVVSRFVPKVIQRIAVQASGEMVEKWAGRVIPVLSSVIGGGLNYFFVRTWGERALIHFRERHMAVRDRMAQRDRAVDVG